MNFTFESKEGSFDLVGSSGVWRIHKLGCPPLQVRLSPLSKLEKQGSVRRYKDDFGYTISILQIRNQIFIHRNGETLSLSLVEKELLTGDNSPEIRSPMPGKLIRIETEVGTTHKKGEVLLVLEAMKMETAVVAPFDCKIEEICYGVGELVQAENILLRLTPIASEKT